MIIDPKNCETKIWIAKFPTWLTDVIMKSEDECVIGTIKLIADVNDTRKILLELNGRIHKQELPVDYELEMTEISSNMYVFKFDGKAVRIEGMINKDCKVSPIKNEKYMEFITNKFSAEPKRETRTIIKGERLFKDKYSTIADLEVSKRKRKKLLIDKKRLRLGKPEVMDLIFKAFENKSQWTPKELADHTGQPINYILEVLPEICNSNKSDYKGVWELKAEYSE